MATCRSCQKRVLWVRVVSTGNLMPVDAEPNADGNVEVSGLVPGAAARDLYSGVVHAQPPLTVAGTLYMPHHATCPQADEWRGNSKKPVRR